MKSLSSPPCVLVVDDDPSLRAMLELSLRQLGFKVGSASSGEEALDRLAAEDFDWLVTDAAMAPMDGFTLVERAQALKPGLRAVMISALPARREPPSPAIEGFFQKPVPLEDLQACLSTTRPTAHRHRPSS